MGEPYSGCGKQYRDIRNEVVAGTQPDGAHVDVIGAMPPEQEKTDAVRGKREQADSTDDLEYRDMRKEYPVNRLPQDEKGKQRHDDALEQGGPGFQARAARDDIEAEAIDQRIAQHIQRIGQQRQGARHKPGRQLHHEHDGIDNQYPLERRALAAAQRVKLESLVIATIGHHPLLKISSVNWNR